MPRIKSAIKRVRTIETKTMQNKVVRSQVATAIKKMKSALNSGDIALCEKLLPITFSEIDSACAHKILHKNNAARKKAALSSHLNKLKTGKIVVAVKVDNKTRSLEKKAAQEAAKLEAKKAAEAKKAEAKKADDTKKTDAKKATATTAKKEEKAPVKKAAAKKETTDTTAAKTEDAKPKKVAKAKTEKPE